MPNTKTIARQRPSNEGESLQTPVDRSLPLPASAPSDAVDRKSLSFLSRARLALKYIMWPGTNWVSRDKSQLVNHLLTGSAENPVRTLDCGCGNAYFTYEAYRRGGQCVGITIHDWEKRNCEEMRDWLGVPESRMSFRTERLERLTDDPANHRSFDQVMLLDVIEHIMDAQAALRQLHVLLDDDGFIYITTPNRNWRGNSSRARVTRFENGWHVRNGFTFEQLEAILDECGFEPIDRIGYGTVGTSVVTWIQHKLFRSRIDSLTTLFMPLLLLVATLLSPLRNEHTIFVLARKKAR